MVMSKKKKGRTEFQERKSRMAKLEYKLKKEKEEKLAKRRNKS